MKQRTLAAGYALAALTGIVIVLARGPVYGGDTSGYLAAATALRSSLVADGVTMARPPLYPMFLAVMPDDRTAALIQTVLVAFVAPLLGVATARHFGDRVGLLVVILVAFEPAFLSWTGYLLTDPFGVLLLGVVIERTSAVLATGTMTGSAIAGVAAGLALITRPALLLPIVVLAAGASLARRPWGPLFIIAAGAVLVIALAAMRGYLASGEPIPYRSQTWFLLWMGTEWEEVGRGTSGVDIPPTDEIASGQEREAYFRSEFLGWLRQHPVEFIWLAARKALWFWLPAYPEWSLHHQVLGWIYYCALYALAAVGVVVTRRHPWSPLMLGGAAGVMATSMLTVVDYDARYRLPAELCLLPLAAVGLTVVWSRLPPALSHQGRLAALLRKAARVAGVP